MPHLSSFSSSLSAATSLSKIESIFTGDVLFLAVLFVIFLAFAIYLGRSRMISLILSFYPAMLLYKTFPFMSSLPQISGSGELIVKFGLFLLFLIPINLIISHYMFSELIHVRSGNIVQTIGLSIVMVLMVVILYYNTIDYSAWHTFSPFINSIFSGADKMFWWNLIPFVFLAIL